MTFRGTFGVNAGECNSKKLEIDEACLEIVSHSSSIITVWAQLTECEKCDFTQFANVSSYESVSVVTSTKFPWDFQLLQANDSSVYCNQHYRFVEYGLYSWNVTNDSCSNINAIHEPSLPYLPILGLFLVLFAAGLVWNVARWIYESDWLARIWPGNIPFSELQNDLGSPSVLAEHEPAMVRAELSPIRRSRTRVLSLDTFRGLSIVLMIFVNYGGGQYSFFKHSPWNGLTVADLVFPWFLWIMGCSLGLSLRARLRSGVPRWRLLRSVLLRSVTLIALGLALNTAGGASSKPVIADLRLPGVLQRIGVAYLVVASLEVVLMKSQPGFRYGRWTVAQDLLDSWAQWLCVVAVTAAQVTTSLVVAPPGCPGGYLGPGGAHRHGRFANCTGGAAGYLDRQVFGPAHIYQHPTSAAVYKTTMPFDPEGLLGTLTAVLTVYLGVHSGRILMCYNYTTQRVWRWLAWATATGLVAGFLCNWSQNDGVIPVNKNLWSLSFALATSSFAYLLHCLLYLLVDDRRWWAGAPLTQVGANAIVLYVGHELTRNVFPWAWRPFYDTHWELLAMDAWGTALWVLIAYTLHAKNIFVTL